MNNHKKLFEKKNKEKFFKGGFEGGGTPPQN